MELLCAERVSPTSGGGSAGRALAAAAADPVLLRRRVLDNLLRTEERYAVTANYFGTVQTELTAHMRRVVAEWMLEVSAPRPFAILSLRSPPTTCWYLMLSRMLISVPTGNFKTGLFCLFSVFIMGMCFDKLIVSVLVYTISC